MNRRKRLIELDNRIEGALLDPIWDASILGIGYDSHTKKVFPVYGYQAMKAILLEKKLNPIAIFHILSNLDNKDIIILKRLSSRVLWRYVRNKHIPAWEHMDRAAIAIHNDKLCYIAQECEAILKSLGTSLYGETDLEETIRIRHQFESDIKGADLGEQSPIFITIIK